MGASEPNGQPWLTIALPVYNVAAYLPACLESIFAQIDHGVEVLAVEDCSTDNTPDVLRAQQQRWPSLRVVQHERNLGLSGARNTGLANAQGTYIWFLDADDLMLPGAIAQLRQTIDQWQPDLVMCDFSVLREQMKLKHKLRGERHRRTFCGPSSELITDPMRLLAGAMKAGQLHTWTKIAKRSLWGDNLLFPVGRAFEDLYTSPALLLQSARAVHVDSPWVAYRQRAGSILSTLNQAKLQDQCSALSAWRMPMANRQDRWARQARFEVDVQSFRLLTGACRQCLRMRQQAPETATAAVVTLWSLTRTGLKSGSALGVLWGLIWRGRLARAARLSYWLIALKVFEVLDCRHAAK
jgi:Glycosyl transferase family 2